MIRYGEVLDGAQAWSVGEQPAEPQPYRERHSWRHAAGAATSIVLTALALAGGVLPLRADRVGPQSIQPTDPPAVPSSPPDIIPDSPLPAPPVPDAKSITADGLYLQLLRAGGWNVSDPRVAASNGREICGLMKDMHLSRLQMVNRLSASGSGNADYYHLGTFVYAAGDAFCPEVQQ